jgi:gliding motility-associated-like protein
LVNLFTCFFNKHTRVGFAANSKPHHSYCITIAALFLCSLANAQLTVNGSIPNSTFQNYLFGPGVKISNLTINCSGLNQYGTFNAQTTQLGVDSGILITTGTVQEAIGPDNNCCSSVAVGTNSTDPCVAAAVGPGQTQYDPCIIEFDIIPTCDTFNVSYVFGSEEYNTGIGGYNDVFGFFVTGPNPAGGTYSCQDFALLPGSGTPVTINNVNFKTNTAYYRDNHGASSNLYKDFQYNGLTVPLVATIPVVACSSYHMKVAVVDIGNPGYDSGVFLKFKSLACTSDQVLTIKTNDSILCAGQNTTLTASGATNCTWLPATGLNTTTGNVVTANPSVTTTYTVSGDGVGSCVTSDSITITVHPTPTVQFKADTVAGCYPVCMTFTDSSTLSSGSITKWDWNFGDGDSGKGQTVHYCYKIPGAFTVNLAVKSNEGCDATETISNMINVYEPPRASFYITPVSTNIFNPTIYFTNQSSDVYGIQTWHWEFGDGQDTGAVNILNHTYQDTGTYCAKLFVTNIHGCMDSTERCAEINPLFTLYVPNAFTPNKDGINDVFMAKGEGMHSFEMWVFDRWGMQIFHSIDINKGWNGRANNTGSTLCEEDTYIWKIDVNDNTNNSQSYIGKVSLVK